jgi:hypothetical protein
MKACDSVWANEGGVQVFFTRTDHNFVEIRVVENYGEPSAKEVNRVTLTNWRWERIVNAMKPPEPASPAAKEGES